MRHSPGPRTVRRWSLYALVLAGLLSACTLLSRDQWRAPLDRDHALVGRLWAIDGGHFITSETLLAEIERVPFVLLGEKHDNPDHHRLQARIVRELATSGRRPAVVFEMLSVDVASPLAEAVARPGVEPSDVRAAVGWDRSGWPAWALYAPVFDAALGARLGIMTGDLPAATVTALREAGRGGLGSEQIATLALDDPLPPEHLDIMMEHIRDAHCGYAPADLAGHMVDAQRARDAHLARQLVAAGHADGAVLIAGIEHVRRDIGVPVYLARWAPARAVAAVGFMEVSAEHTDASATLAARYGESVPFDYVWFTPRVDDDDPCARFRKQLEKLRTGGEATRPPS